MTKISALSDIGTSVASNDTFVLVDVSDPTTPNKKIQQQNLFLIPDGSAGTPGLRFLSDTNVGLFRPTTDTLAIATGGSERLRIDSSGRLGLGTSLPSANIHIRGAGQQAFRITNTTAGFNLSPQVTKIDFEGYNGTTVSLEAQDRSVNTIGGWLNIKTQNSSYALATAIHIDNQQRVGIGTTSPVDDLTVEAQQSSGGITVTRLSGTPRIKLYGNSASPAEILFGDTLSGSGSEQGRISYDNSTDALRFFANAGERARIDSSGRLLVGTSSSRPTLYGTERLVQIEGTSSATASLSVFRNSNDAAGGSLTVGKSRGASNGSNTVVQSGDYFGGIFFVGADGTNPEVGCSIEGQVDGTPGADNMPGKLVFSTTADGASGLTTRATIDSSGRLLIGTSTARTNTQPLGTTGLAFNLQHEGTSASAGLSLIRNSVDAGGSYLALGKTRGTSVASNTVVASEDTTGVVAFLGADGTNLLPTATIISQVDGTPGANDMPGRLVFSVTADGASSPTEAMRIKNTRVINFSNAPVYADNAAAKTGGLVDGDVYRTSTGDLKIVYT